MQQKNRLEHGNILELSLLTIYVTIMLDAARQSYPYIRYMSFTFIFSEKINAFIQIADYICVAH